MCVLQEDSDSGLGMCSHSLDCRAFCSSTLTAWMQSTVLLVWPVLPQLAEHFCHSPTHHLSKTDAKDANISNLVVHLWWRMTIHTLQLGKSRWLTHMNLDCCAIMVQKVGLYRSPALDVHIVPWKSWSHRQSIAITYCFNKTVRFLPDKTFSPVSHLQPPRNGHCYKQKAQKTQI